MRTRAREDTSVGRTEGTPYFAVITLQLQGGLEVLDSLGTRSYVSR